jgi:hypothetical protein
MNLPAHLQRYQARDIGTTLSHNLGTAPPPYVSIAGNRFSLIDAAGNEQPVPTFDPQIGVYLDACVIDANEHISRIYYAQKYDPSAAIFNPPDCWSDNGVAPSVSCSAPQARSCTPDPDHVHGCKWAVWGSATSAQGKAVPACQQVQKIALLIPGMQTLFLLRVPPNSHKHLRAYQETCKGSGVMIADVITRIHFDQSTQGTLLFKGVNYIDEATAQLREAAYNEKKTDALVGRNDVPRVAIAAPAAQPAIEAPTGVAPGFPGGGPAAIAAPIQQGQQPGPFAPTPAGGAAVATGPLQQNPAQPAATTSPSEPAPAQRRRRRTAAEMQQAQPGATNGTAAPAPAQTAPQAPFPHPGSAAGGQQTAATASFGIAQGQPAAANPELAGMLDNFFKS